MRIIAHALVHLLKTTTSASYKSASRGASPSDPSALGLGFHQCGHMAPGEGGSLIPLSALLLINDNILFWRTVLERLTVMWNPVSFYRLVTGYKLEKSLNGAESDLPQAHTTEMVTFCRNGSQIFFFCPVSGAEMKANELWKQVSKYISCCHVARVSVAVYQRAARLPQPSPSTSFTLNDIP